MNVQAQQVFNQSVTRVMNQMNEQIRDLQAFHEDDMNVILNLDRQLHDVRGLLLDIRQALIDQGLFNDFD
jgi:hypothetical protein